MEGKREEQSHLEAGISSDMALVAAAAEATSTADVEVDVGPEEEGRDVAVAVPVAVAAATAEPVTTFNAVVEEGTKERLAGVGAPSSVTVTALEAVAAATEAAAEEAAAEKAGEDNEEASICVICLSRFSCYRICCIPCGHLFCRSCLEIVPQRSCPTCKHMFILEDIINLDACSRLRGLRKQMGQQFHALMKQYGVDLTLKREEHLARLLSELAEEKEKFESTLLIEAKKKLSQHKK